ncbi:GNAT family N-acetyltransferase [Arthrobacter roseus]|uniref:GNAT family N-acetyltransferase n=1 Tax=Arthrobacter roseus TaxID=136274 RepID=UPI001964CE0B|nr:GNAT family protein [Arthrobacter roseus]MBM7849356.1 hypothetical protein [Arthrobacter roseus]
MDLEPGTQEIVLLAWSRQLGLRDDALSAAKNRVYVVKDGAAAISFVRLFGREVFSGPRWAVDSAAGVCADDLARHATLVQLSREHGGHGLGEASLYFSDELPNAEVHDGASVSTDVGTAQTLETLCPPDDAADAGLSLCDRHWVLVDGHEKTSTPLAGAGYSIWEGFLAHMAVIASPPNRGRGHSRNITSIAVEEALASGLVPQWRARNGNAASHALARRLGFTPAGSQTSVLLGS